MLQTLCYVLCSISKTCAEVEYGCVHLGIVCDKYSYFCVQNKCEKLFPVPTRTPGVMAGASTLPEDISGVLRGRRKECECDGFRRTVELVSQEIVPLGWCILCGHAPVAHGALTGEPKVFSNVFISLRFSNEPLAGLRQ